MKSRSLPETSISYAKQWQLGQKLIYLSSGLAGRISAETLARFAGVNSAILPVSSELTPLEVMNIAKAAHEIWILDGEVDSNPSIQHLCKYRMQSIPVSAGEHCSLLHAPELGLVRVFSEDASGTLIIQYELLPLGESISTLDSACGDIVKFAKRIASIDPDSILRARVSTGHALEALPSEQIERLVSATTSSANLDECALRRVIAALFGITVGGVIFLQTMTTAGLQIPMADIYAVYFMLVGSAYFWAREHHLNDRQLVYRLIAQTLEVHLLWQRASLNESVVAHFQLRHHASLQWVRELLRFSSLTVPGPNLRASSKAVLAGWLPRAISRNSDLANWHARRASQIYWSVRVCYGLGGLLTLVLVIGPPLTNVPNLVAGACLGIASSLGTLLLIFGGTLGYMANADLHQHLAHVLRRTQQSLGLELPDHEYDELLRDAGRECIQSAVERAFR
jgi:hypothetical protein